MKISNTIFLLCGPVVDSKIQLLPLPPGFPPGLVNVEGFGSLWLGFNVAVLEWEVNVGRLWAPSRGESAVFEGEIFTKNTNTNQKKLPTLTKNTNSDK